MVCTLPTDVATTNTTHPRKQLGAFSSTHITICSALSLSRVLVHKSLALDFVW